MLKYGLIQSTTANMRTLVTWLKVKSSLCGCFISLLKLGFYISVSSQYQLTRWTGGVQNLNDVWLFWMKPEFLFRGEELVDVLVSGFGSAWYLFCSSTSVLPDTTLLLLNVKFPKIHTTNRQTLRQNNMCNSSLSCYLTSLQVSEKSFLKSESLKKHIRVHVSSNQNPPPDSAARICLITDSCHLTFMSALSSAMLPVTFCECSLK